MMLTVWLIAYALPAFLTACWIKLFSHQQGGSPKNLIIVHIMLVVSSLLSLGFARALGFVIPLPHAWSFALYAVSVVFAGWMIGWLGLWYGFSAFLQQLCMLSIALILLPAYPLWAVVLLIVPLFVFCHQLTGVPYWRLRIVLISVWGAASIVLFSYVPDILLIAALHTLMGALLIKRSVLYGIWKR